MNLGRDTNIQPVTELQKTNSNTEVADATTELAKALQRDSLDRGGEGVIQENARKRHMLWAM